MSIVITDPNLLAQLLAAGNHTELTTPDGTLIGNLVTEYPGSPPPGTISRYSAEEIDKRRKDTSEHKLSDILQELQERYPE